MNELKAEPGELRIGLTITRASGKVEQVELIGKATPEQLAQVLEQTNERHTLDIGEERGD